MGLGDIFNIKNKTILITGASGFFGRHIARGFLDVGANLILLSRNKRLFLQGKQYRKEYPTQRIDCYILDFYDHAAIRRTMKFIVHSCQIDCLVNNAYDVSSKTGFNTPDGRLEKTDAEQWRAASDCLYWNVLMTQYMKGMKNCSIINIASMYSLISPNPEMYQGFGLNPPTYSAMKAALCAFTRYTASFWGHYGIRCNAVLPGAFPNLEFEGPNTPDKTLLKNLRKLQRTSLGRLGHPKELIGLLIYLASDASSYMTGQSLVIDGGWTVR